MLFFTLKKLIPDLGMVFFYASDGIFLKKTKKWIENLKKRYHVQKVRNLKIYVVVRQLSLAREKYYVRKPKKIVRKSHLSQIGLFMDFKQLHKQSKIIFPIGIHNSRLVSIL